MRDGAAGAPPALYAAFTISGCAALEFAGPGPRCTGPAPLSVRLLPITVGAAFYRWQVLPLRDGGAPDAILDEARARERTPEVVLPWPGEYRVTLAVGGAAGTASAVGAITVEPAGLGAPCDEDGQCRPELRCLCGRSAACPGALRAGLCTRACASMPCPAGAVCLDLQKSQGAVDGGGDPWREPVCVPACTTDRDCRPGLSCRELPVRQGGFAMLCFIGQPSGVGGECAGPGGEPDRTACATGLCEPLGARNLCTAPCDPGPCPAAAACAAWNGPAPAPPGSRCLALCDAAHPCTDPLLSCQAGGGPGALAFRLPAAPPGTTVCAPRRCTTQADCKTGRCAALGGASFCVR